MKLKEDRKMEVEELEVGKQAQTIVNPMSGEQATKFVYCLDEPLGEGNV
jgi:hypothetical protein